MEIKDGKFLLTNHGRRPIYIDGQPLLTDKSVTLYHNQLLEVINKLLLNPKCIKLSFRSAPYHFLFY